MTVIVKWNGEIIEVHGCHTKGKKGDGYLTPDDGGEFEIEEIIYNGENVYLILQDRKNEIANLCLEELN